MTWPKFSAIENRKEDGTYWLYRGRHTKKSLQFFGYECEVSNLGNLGNSEMVQSTGRQADWDDRKGDNGIGLKHGAFEFYVGQAVLQAVGHILFPIC